jgi:alkanesulfonate monooxygenase SsuD/methylene tetrahydromethanopterin reductase-like flavin-dependent oxidoreductase (luciferase family)
MFELSQRDRRHVSPSMLAASFSGTREELRARLTAYREQGLSELLYAPTGPHPESALERMAEVFRGL